ncbi:rCG50094 [Rattus norvegicus]|uniref:RCG50094 n=1 Tax=Rattus norvegicus TaxID=10116 RepID=A6JV83_RAT|nr:rCG50094 [Rattus norvegicus]
MGEPQRSLGVLARIVYLGADQYERTSKLPKAEEWKGTTTAGHTVPVPTLVLRNPSYLGR